MKLIMSKLGITMAIGESSSATGTWYRAGGGGMAVVWQHIQYT